MRKWLVLTVALALGLGSMVQAASRWCPFPKDKLGCDGECTTTEGEKGTLIGMEVTQFDQRICRTKCEKGRPSWCDHQ